MLSALVTAFPQKSGDPSPEAVVRTLGALVPAAVAGLIGDVALIGPDGFVDLGAIADHAGCELLVGERESAVLRQALAARRREAVLVMLPGYAPGPGFLEELADMFGPSEREFRAAILRERPDGLLGFIGRRRIAGILARKDALLRLPLSSFDRLVKKARSSRNLRCGARRIG
jgi:hypothetical protein